MTDYVRKRGGYQSKPRGVLSVNGYYAPVLAFCDGARQNGFVRDVDRAGLLSGDDLDGLLSELVAQVPAAKS